MKRLEGKHAFKSGLIVLFALISFALIIAIVVRIGEFKKLSYDVNIKFDTTDVIYLTNKLPISDAIGKNYTGTGMEKNIAEYKKFVVTNPNEGKIEYEVYLKKIENSKRDISSNYIKLYLTDDNDNPMKGFEKPKVNSYYDLYSLNNQPGSKLLYRGTLKAHESAKFILRSWVADTYIISSDLEDFSFDIDVRIK